MKEKCIIPLLAMWWVLAAVPAWSGHVDVGINVNIGAAVPVPVIVSEPPLFLAPAPLGFQVAVGVPYDLCMVGGRYYLLHGDVWHVGPGYNGPWQVIHHDHLPPGLRRHKLHEIRSYREREYAVFKKDKDHYRGRSYQPERYYRDHDHNRDRGRDWNHRPDDDQGRGHDRDRYQRHRADRDGGRDHDRYRGKDLRGDHDRGRERGRGRDDHNRGHDRGHDKEHEKGKGKWN